MIRQIIVILSLFLVFGACKQPTEESVAPSVPVEQSQPNTGVSLVVLGTIQDAGSPHIGCKRACCANLFDHPDPTRQVVSLGVIDWDHQQTYLFEATPDISRQLKKLTQMASFNQAEMPNGIFLTHAHIGHYTGLQYLGKEATNADQVPVFAMDRMSTYLETNGPWSQLVAQQNIQLQPLIADQPVQLNDQLAVTPLQVPHRDEYSETVGYRIDGPQHKVLFIPDIDKWEKWERSIITQIAEVDFAFIDATFYHGQEINMRDISQIPHPFIIESMELFKDLPEPEKQKIRFIHFNHTNPVLNPESTPYATMKSKGFSMAQYGQIYPL